MKLRRRTAVTGVVMASVLGLAIAAAIPADAVAPLQGRGKGKVTSVNSGDALKVKINGSVKTVRLSNIQAPEDAGWNPRGKRECSYTQSLNRLTKLTKGKKVVLKSQKSSSGSLGRPMRNVYVYNSSTKKYTDVATSMLKAGEAFYQYFPTESANDATYQALTETAARGGRGIFNTTRCGVGPQQDVPIKIWAQWDADYDDNAAPNGEIIVVQNNSTTKTLNLGNWILRTPAQTYYYFPTWAKVPPRGFVRVHVGKGKNTATDFYWGSSKSILGNVTGPRTGGSAVYLLDPQTDFRAWFMWPCRTVCSDPAKTNVVISQVQYNNTPASKTNLNEQFVTIVNRSKARQQLGGHFLRVSAWYYTFYPGQYLDPGERWTIRMGSGTGDRLNRYFNGKPGPLSTARAVELGNWNGMRLHCIRGSAQPC